MLGTNRYEFQVTHESVHVFVTKSTRSIMTRSLAAAREHLVIEPGFCADPRPSGRNSASGR